MDKFKALSRRWKRSGHTKRIPPSVFLTPNSTLHILPLEIRLEIYSYLTGHPSPLQPPSHPPSHPLYHLLFVCHLLRTDIANIFYSSIAPTLKFMTSESCLFFLETTTSYIHLLTSLTIYLPAQRTESLEPIARKLYLAKAPLRSLTIHLVSLPERFNTERIVTAYMLPRRIGISASGYHEMKRREDSPYFWSGNSQMTSTEHFVFADTHSGLAIRLSESCNAALGMLKSLRYLAVHGQPKEGLDFELAVLKLHLRMLQVAKSEGREVILGKKVKRHEDEFGFYEVWIHGEVEDEE